MRLTSLALMVCDGLSHRFSDLFGYFMGGRSIPELKSAVAYRRGAVITRATFLKMVFAVLSLVFWFFNSSLPDLLSKAYVPDALTSFLQHGSVKIAAEFVIEFWPALIFGYACYAFYKVKRRHFETLRKLSNWDYRISRIMADTSSISLLDIIEEYCGLSTEVFQAEMPKAQIGCAFRLWTEDGLVTIVRSGCLSPNRAESSKPLDNNSPLLHVVLDKKYQDYSVFAVENTRLAFVDDDDPNRHDEAFSREDSSLLVSRIFVREEDESVDSLIGLFYITSAHRYAFDSDTIDLFYLLSTRLNTLLLRLLDEI